MDKKKIISYIDRIYDNCLTHIDTPGFWQKAWDAFENVAEKCHHDAEIVHYIIGKMKQLEKEAHIFEA